MTKERLDRLLVARGLVAGRNQAFSAVVAGEVRVDGEVCRRPDIKIDTQARIDYSSSQETYASRGGTKLEKALDYFAVEVAGQTVLDAGASTGGFTDCLIRRRAAAVLAVDVGYGQLAWRLRNDSRVHVMERVNLRYLAPEQAPFICDLATLDLSFISLKKVTEAVLGLLRDGGEILALVKPQFEAGKSRVGRGGVVKDREVHVGVLKDLAAFFIDNGCSLLGLTFSPIKGPKGNIEFWIHLSKTASVGYPIKGIDDLVDKTVGEAHDRLGAQHT